MRYVEYAPLARLAPFVRCVWTLEGQATGEVSPVLPDGRPELILHLGDPFELIDARGVPSRQPAAVFAGQLTERLLMRPRGRAAVVGVRFHPHSAAALLPIPQSELAGPPIAIDVLSAPLTRAVESVRSATADPAEAAALLQIALCDLLNAREVDARVRVAVECIDRARGNIAMTRVAEAAGLTPRHLERLFYRHVGVGPKRLARIARFQRAIVLLESGGMGGAETAADCGYADQAHFVRDFRLLAGCSPSAHLLSGTELTGFFIPRR